MGAGRSSGRRFDREHGVTTQALFLLSQLGNVEGAAYRHATHYEPVALEAFRALLTHLGAPFIRSATFVDVGSGMGRAVLLASEHPFKQVVGVELSPALHAIATANLRAARQLAVRCRDVRLRCCDARRYRFPKGDLAVFLFNPFDDAVLDAVLRRITGSRAPADRAILLYHVPVHRDVVARYAGETLTDSSEGLIVRLVSA